MKEQVHLLSENENDFEYQKIRQQEYRQSAAGRWPLLNAIDLYLVSHRRTDQRSNDAFEQTAGHEPAPPTQPSRIGSSPPNQAGASKIRFVRWPS